jgi:GxxExxY protein
MTSLDENSFGSATLERNAKGAKEAQRSQRDDGGSDGSREIIAAAIEVQKGLGMGLLESAYAAAFALELSARGIGFEREVPVHVNYKGVPLGVGFRADFIVARAIIVELKAVEGLVDVQRAQLLTYLRATGLKIGLLINFHVSPITKGISRVVHRL